MARMNRAGGDPNVLNLTALEHQAILIQIPGDDETYFVDVGMGFSITRPAPLKVGYEFEGLAPQKFRFTRGYHPDSPLVNKEAEEWRLQTNMDQRSNLIRDPGWITFMQFSTQPYYPKDIAGFNWLSHTRPDAILPKLVVAMIFSGGKRKGESLRQKIVAGDSFLSRTAGCAVEIVKFESEDERIAVLTESFGIECPADSKECIAGKPSAIGVKVDK
ncbi:hypothetical protein FRB93_011352 [Tulasnella sp. JGI-2019a]|nr:hypothetical protein FRB93_011352 [Tulasnella sp. JGI-2019a]